MFFFLIHFFVALAVCFGSFFMLDGTHPRRIFNALALTSTFHRPFDGGGSCSVLLAEKQPQSIMFPPLCLKVSMVFLGS